MFGIKFGNFLDLNTLVDTLTGFTCLNDQKLKAYSIFAVSSGLNKTIWVIFKQMQVRG